MSKSRSYPDSSRRWKNMSVVYIRLRKLSGKIRSCNVGPVVSMMAVHCPPKKN